MGGHAGLRGLGRELARQLGRDFFDSDAEIERRTGVDIPFIFEKEGEAGFRRRETQVIEELTARQDIVLATGGGAVLAEQNRRALASRGTVIYLEASVRQQLARTRRSQNRPLLQTADPGTRLESLMAQREPLYRQLADVTVSTDGRKVRQVATEIRALLEGAGE